ncbi:hypothetical protein [Deinococcus sp. QL22]|nr:hypothetical protein [Deinococcus sp. QL22]UQN08164.1 hypothetical protein M1R55_18955 [Deinococcus sp. QL22]
MNVHLYIAQSRSRELRAETQRDREARSAQNQSKRPSLLQLTKALILPR